MKSFTTRWRWTAALAGALLVVAGTVAVATPASAATTYLYTTFKGDGAAATSP